MKRKTTAAFLALSMILSVNVFAAEIEIEEEAPSFEILVDGEQAEEMTEAVQAIETESECEPSENESAINIEEETMTETEQPTEAFSEEVFDGELLEPYYYEAEPQAEVYDVGISVDDKAKTAEINISGVSLTDRLVSIKISPLGGYNEVYYIRSVKLSSDAETIFAGLPQDAAGLCSVDVDMAELGHWRKIAVAGESENLTCVSNRKTAVISGKCSKTGINSVQIKVMDENGNVVFLRQKNSDADGSFTLNVTLPAESPSYVVWVTVGTEPGGYAKTIVPFRPTEAKYTYEFSAEKAAGEYTDVAIYGKNIADKKKYVYELDYSAATNVLTLTDACALNGDKVLAPGICDNTDIEIISITDGKIRFVVNSDVNDGMLWSGTLNLIRFKHDSAGKAGFTLRIYE